MTRIIGRQRYVNSDISWRGVAGLLILGFLAILMPATNPAPPGDIAWGNIAKGSVGSIGDLPLGFEVNRGQAAADVKFLARGNGYTAFLTPAEVVLALIGPSRSGTAVLRMRLAGANPHPKMAGRERLSTVSHYFLGNDPSKWQRNIPHFGRVEYRDVYPGIDLMYYSRQGELEYDFVIAPGADPQAIQLSLEGARSLALDRQGNLIIQTAGGHVRLRKPFIYQDIGTAKKEVVGGYVLDQGHLVGFRVADYDGRKPLVIDPVVSFSTYLGGAADEFASEIARDSTGNIYLAGGTASLSFPPVTPTTLGPVALFNAFVAKLNPTATALSYVTYVGGSGGANFDEAANGIGLDAAGNVYIAGLTTSFDFPVTAGAFQNVAPGGLLGDGFLAKLDPSGSTLLYSTYLGGTDGDGVIDLAIDAAGTAYVVGFTYSSDFPTTPTAYQPTSGGAPDAFVARLDPGAAGAASLLYATYLGGSAADGGMGVAVDPSSNAFVLGSTGSFDFPVTSGAFDTTFGGGVCAGVPCSDAFVAKLNPAAAGAASLIYATYLGGSNNDIPGTASDIALDPAGNAYVTGMTASSPMAGTGFPTTPGASQTTYGGGSSDAFLTKINATGTGLLYSTYLGGSAFENGDALALDPLGRVYVMGSTSSPNFRRVRPLQSRFAGGPRDAFVARWQPSGPGLVLSFATYLGGTGNDAGTAIKADVSGNMYVAGFTDSSDFPTTPGTLHPTAIGGFDLYVMKIAP